MFVGKVAMLSPFTILTSNPGIKKYFQINTYSYLTHDCLIGDFITFALGVECNGSIVVEDYAHIGSSAIIN